MGATGFAYDLARQFGLGIVEPRPGLVPLTVADGLLQVCKSLTGVSADSTISCGKTSFRENLLFSHRGLSGPAILQISSYWKDGESIVLDLLPGTNAEAFLKDRKRARPKAELKTILSEVLPSRLADIIADEAPDGAIANLPDRALAGVAEKMNRWRVKPSGMEGWAKAEVT